MFSFHKPKIYRSNLGCCICKAKSSSSRFTDSQKYENEFERCFRIQEKRSGEICNACVLLVKRWKKLSPDNRLTKHWHHVVDARAGPGTKLTNIRRITKPTSSSGGSSSSSSATMHNNNNSSGGSNGHERRQQKSDLLPLTSNQSANSSGHDHQSSTGGSSGSAGPRRRGSFSGGAGGISAAAINKARAVDTNVSTFTFGETTRRNYMALESTYFNTSSSGNSLSKPQSALNSSAFESVIKRFRQRQQQQQLEANRRQQQRLQKIQRRGQALAPTSTATCPPAPDASGPASSSTGGCQSSRQHKRQLPVQLSESKKSSPSGSQQSAAAAPEVEVAGPPHPKRVKRLSESIGSLTVDGIRITNLLDGSIWRKEKTCCGMIFRGLHNEVAVFPKLLRPCQARLKPASEPTRPTVAGRTRDASPPPRTTKSGSVSSCDSNTSGTGSMMDAPMDYAAGQAVARQQQQRRRILAHKSASAASKSSSSARNQSNTKHQRDLQQSDLNLPMNCASSCEETNSSSGASMSHLALLMDCEDAEDGALVVCGMNPAGEDFECSTDGSSESLSSSASESMASSAAAESSRRSQAKKSSNSVVGAAS